MPSFLSHFFANESIAACTNETPSCASNFVQYVTKFRVNTRKLLNARFQCANSLKNSANKNKKKKTVSIPCAKKCCYSSQLILKYVQYFTFLSIVFEKQISAAFGSVQTEKISF